MKTDTRKINFGAGPAMLPPEVLLQASQAVLDYNQSGMSILEIPHRGQLCRDMIDECTALVKELCGIGDDFHVIWQQGGGRQQFCMIPMNFLRPDATAGFLISGHWSKEAMEYAHFYGNVNEVASSEPMKFNCLPAIPVDFSQELAYLHYTTNNTIFGTQWHDIPQSGAVPLIADMSSDILSSERDYSRFSLFYAVAQKNLGAAGNCLVAIRKDFLDRQVSAKLPPSFDFKAQVAERSVLNTANAFAIYVTLLMLKWIKAKGILSIDADNKLKSSILYLSIDDSPSFVPYVANKAHRSNMNVCFFPVNPDVEARFNNLCKQNNITGIAGHRSAGGYRVSLYNAISVQNVQLLAEIIASI